MQHLKGQSKVGDARDVERMGSNSGRISSLLAQIARFIHANFGSYLARCAAAAARKVAAAAATRSDDQAACRAQGVASSPRVVEGAAILFKTKNSRILF